MHPYRLLLQGTVQLYSAKIAVWAFSSAKTVKHMNYSTDINGTIHMTELFCWIKV